MNFKNLLSCMLVSGMVVWGTHGQAASTKVHEFETQFSFDERERVEIRKANKIKASKDIDEPGGGNYRVIDIPPFPADWGPPKRFRFIIEFEGEIKTTEMGDSCFSTKLLDCSVDTKGNGYVYSSLVSNRRSKPIHAVRVGDEQGGKSRKFNATVEESYAYWQDGYDHFAQTFSDDRRNRYVKFRWGIGVSTKGSLNCKWNALIFEKDRHCSGGLRTRLVGPVKAKLTVIYDYR